jgi:uncharacterized circularly permuted ATP-grasp superfamily protein
MAIDWNLYDPKGGYDELIGSPGNPRPSATNLTAWLRSLSDEELQMRKLDAELAIIDKGVTFTVYSDGENIDRAWPFDIIPRVLPLSEWRGVEAGLKQRLKALNLFIDDLYHAQKVLEDGVVPRELIANSKGFRQECVGIHPAHGVWPTSAAATWCGMPTAPSMSWKITCGCLQASPT